MLIRITTRDKFVILFSRLGRRVLWSISRIILEYYADRIVPE